MQIYHYNYVEDIWSVHGHFDCELDKKPEIFVFNNDQTIAFVSAHEDIFFINFKKEQEFDIDTMYRIGEVKACHYYKRKFLILANNCEKVKGVYLFCIDESCIDKKTNRNIIIKWTT